MRDYSIDTLRDVEIASLSNDQVLTYDSNLELWENKSPSRYGEDFNSIIKDSTETTSGNQFSNYSTLNFNVSRNEANRYRLNAEFFWSHNSASNDIRIRVLLDGNQVAQELRIEPKDSGSDQRIQNNILFYAQNLSIGNHTFQLQYRPASSSRVSRMHYSTLECWRVS